jgi:serpin B
MPTRVSFLALSLLSVGCAQPMPGQTLMGTVSRRMAPSTADLGTLSSENAAFSLELLDTVYEAEPGNTVLSPWSLQSVLAQVYAGGDSAVQSSISDTFGWSLSGDALHEAFDAADLSVVSHDAPAAEPAVALTTTNQIFSDVQFDIGADWLDTLSEFYGTGVQQMDLANDSVRSADAINAWVEDRTGGHITDLLEADTVAQSGLLLVNAVYFNASWPVQFSVDATQDAPFTLLDGSAVDVPMMSGSVSVSAAVANGFLVADLPYSDPSLTLTVVVPDEGRFTEVLGGLDVATLDAAVASEVACGECAVSLPRFEVKSAPDLDPALIAMGLGAAYGGAYPGISDLLTLASVAQQGFISVSETGTEAAAATVAEFAGTAYEDPPIAPVVIDRPFFYLVREVGGAVLFAGVVTDPR